MKKIWKNLCAVSMALACGTGLVACGEDEKKVSKDLDGDGLIASWETLFDVSSEQTTNSSVPLGDIVHISNADQLKDINNNTDSRKIYVLDADIDLGGAEVAINLGKSEFYGNNHVIDNFKLASINTDNLTCDESYNEKIVRCLFYGGTGVFNTRIFMGVQGLDIDKPTNNIYYSISPIFNVPVVSGVQVKGRINVNPTRVDGRSLAKVEASLLYSGMNSRIVSESEDVEDKIIENIVAIENSNVDGMLVVNEVKSSMLKVDAGAIASRITKGSTVYNSFVQAEIVAGMSMETSNIGGVVGANEGFVSTCTFTGSIKLNNDQNNYADRECVGGIVGLNDRLAEIKNCTTNATISCVNTVDEIVDNKNYFFGGIAGVNNGGVLELCQSDANLNFDNITSVVTGGFVGKNEKGIISYGICRGSITVSKVQHVTLAQVAGMSNAGYFEKLITTTGLNVDNSAITSKDVIVGAVTTFEEVAQSPYFSKILVDGKTEVFVRNQDTSTVDYAQGIRCPYQVLVGQEEGEDIFDTVLPSIFENVYKTTTCAFEKYSLVNVDNFGTKVNDGVSASYVSAVGTITPTTRWMIDYLDFKNYLNHNEVSMGEQLVFGELCFTVDDKVSRMTSYFGYSQYNGELAYFDKSFEQAYLHTDNATGSCENDTVDELFSFVYSLIANNNGKSKENYVIKLNNDFLQLPLDGEEDMEIGMGLKTYLFKSKLENVFVCLNTTPTVTKLDENNNDLDLDDTGSLDLKYLVFSFSDKTNNYTMKIDVSNLENLADDTVFTSEYILYLTFTISSKIG